MAEKLYEEKGIALAKKIIKEKFKTAHLADVPGLPGYKYIHDDTTGKALSPVCVGENSAWRFAALNIYLMPTLFDQTMVEIKD